MPQEHVANCRASATHAVASIMDPSTGDYDYLPYFYSRIFDLSWQVNHSGFLCLPSAQLSPIIALLTRKLEPIPFPAIASNGVYNLAKRVLLCAARPSSAMMCSEEGLYKGVRAASCMCLSECMWRSYMESMRTQLPHCSATPAAASSAPTLSGTARCAPACSGKQKSQLSNSIEISQDAVHECSAASGCSSINACVRSSLLALLMHAAEVPVTSFM